VVDGKGAEFVNREPLGRDKIWSRDARADEDRLLLYSSRMRRFRKPCLVFAVVAMGPLALGQQTAPAPPSEPPPAEQQTVGAQQTASPDPAKRPFARRFVADEFQMWTSPLRRDSYDAHTVKKYLIPIVAISGILIATDKQTGDLLPNTDDQTTWSGRVSQIGASYTLVGGSAATLLVGHLIGDKHASEAGWLALQAVAHTQIAVFAVKQLTNRQRPLVDEGNGGFWSGGDSFPSGHAATSFAVATVFAYEYRDHIAIPIGAYALATTVAASRVGARRHWVSDVVVGGSLGVLIGRFVYKHHHDPNLPGSPVTRTSRLTPEFGLGGSGLALTWRW
jgi:membrane-associated phospholipid phosphatase